MAKTKEQKAKTLKDIVDKFRTAKSVVFANFQGLKVKESEEMRVKCREQNIPFVAVKKTLLQKAFNEINLDADAGKFSGGVAAAFGIQDEAAPAQILADFAKKHETIKFFGGILEGRFIDAEKVTHLSKLPTKRELYAKLVGSLNSPVSGFVNVLVGNLRGLVNVLNNLKETKS